MIVRFSGVHIGSGASDDQDTETFSSASPVSPVSVGSSVTSEVGFVLLKYGHLRLVMP